MTFSFKIRAPSAAAEKKPAGREPYLGAPGYPQLRNVAVNSHPEAKPAYQTRDHAGNSGVPLFTLLKAKA